MRDYQPVPPPEPSEDLQNMRVWRSGERKRMVESLDRLIGQAQKLAESKYTRSNQRARWTRLAGQLIWYKDQILRGLTMEVLEQEVYHLRVQVEEAQREQSKPHPLIIRPAPSPTFKPTIVKKSEEKGGEDEDSLYRNPSSEPEAPVA